MDSHRRRKTDHLGEVVTPPLVHPPTTSWFVLQLWHEDEDENMEWVIDIQLVEGLNESDALTQGMKDLPSADDFAKDDPRITYASDEPGNYVYMAHEVNPDYILDGFFEVMDSAGIAVDYKQGNKMVNKRQIYDALLKLFK